MHEQFKHISAEERLKMDPRGLKRLSRLPGTDFFIVPVASEPLQIPFDQLGADALLTPAAEDKSRQAHLNGGSTEILLEGLY